VRLHSGLAIKISWRIRAKHQVRWRHRPRSPRLSRQRLVQTGMSESVTAQRVPGGLAQPGPHSCGRNSTWPRRGAAPDQSYGDDAALHVAGSALWLVATSAGFPATAEDRLRNIQAITDAALAHLDVEGLLDELLDRVREILEVDTAAVLLLDPSGQQLVATAASGLEEEIRQGTRLPVGKGFAGRVAAEQRPVIGSGAELRERRHCNFNDPGTAGCA
jgi:GAF domain